MGQKTNPKGFRLVTTQKHLSSWYSKKQAYSLLIKEDFFLRTKIEKSFKGLLVISSIEVDRNITQKVSIKINALYPRVKMKPLYPPAVEIFTQIKDFYEERNEAQKGKFFSSYGHLRRGAELLFYEKLEILTQDFRKNSIKIYDIKFNFILNPFEDAVLIAKYIGAQLKNRIAFRRIIKRTIKKIRRTSIKGLKIQVSGRLNGIEIARSEWKREGSIPLHTLNKKIDYAHQYANTVDGTIGTKVWLFNG